MRILFSFAGGRGHAEPLVPLARAAVAAGHVVAFTGKERILGGIDFPGFPSGARDREPPERLPLQRLDPVKEDRDLREGFADRIARRRAGDVLELCAEWGPDVLVCDELDFGAMIAAERLALPYAIVLVTAAGSFIRHDVVAAPLQRVRAEHGLAADPDLEMLHRHLVLSPFPPSLRDPAFPLPGTAHSLRLHAAGPSARAGGRPTVYFTLGTVFNVESGDLFARVLAGLAALDADVVATVGLEIDPVELEPLPAGIRVERFVPQSELLPRCRAVVAHGGSGTVLGALAHGLPLVLLPLGADQPLTAARCEALGVARVLDASDATPASVREAVSSVLTEPEYRAAAQRLRDELAGLPRPERAVALIEQIALSGRTRPAD